MTATKFWIVIKENDGRYYRHQTLQHAMREAERLAGLEGKPFYVATAKRRIVPGDRSPGLVEVLAHPVFGTDTEIRDAAG